MRSIPSGKKMWQTVPPSMQGIWCWGRKSLTILTEMIPSSKRTSGASGSKGELMSYSHRGYWQCMEPRAGKGCSGESVGKGTGSLEKMERLRKEEKQLEAENGKVEQ